MSTRKILSVSLVSAFVLAAGACQSVDSDASSAYDGAALYQEHCASCHGVEGAGDGPVARLLIQPVPDLRAIDMGNKLELIAAIDGRGMREAHGTLDMPVWGWAFREMERSENQVQARLNALADYLLTLQSSP